MQMDICFETLLMKTITSRDGHLGHPDLVLRLVLANQTLALPHVALVVHQRWT